MIKTFENLEVRKTAQELTIDVYILFKESKEYIFKDQLFRASLSIMNNIAE